MSHPQETWSKEENSRFEDALAEHFKQGSEDELLAIASKVPTKTLDQVKHHLKILMQDLDDIESDIIPLPNYADDVDVHPDSAKESVNSSPSTKSRSCGVVAEEEDLENRREKIDG